MNAQRRLAWGADWLVPEDAKAAWGARLIMENGHADLLWDRQSDFGDKADYDRLISKLNEVKPWRGPLEKLIRQGEVRSDEANEVTVYEDDVIVVRGNSNGSYGYFYIAAWLKEEEK